MIIQRTIFKELLLNLSVIVFSLSVILFMEKFVRLTRLFMGKGADFTDILEIFLYLQPSILLLAVPMAVLISVFLTYGRMATDNELVVLKGSGMSFFGIAGAAVALSALCSAALLFVSLYLLPWGMVSFKKTLYETIVKKASMTFEEESFSDVFKGTVIYVKEIPARDEFRGIFVYREADKAVQEPVMIVAEKGVITSNPEEGLIQLTMNNGLVHSYHKKGSTEITFKKYDLVLTTGLGPIEKIKPDEIKTSELFKGSKEQIPWAVEFHRRLALPFACMIFGVLGPALTSRIGKIGRLGGFTFSLFILILYYVILILGESFTKAGEVPAFVGGWMPNVFFGVLAAVFFYRAYMDKPLRRF